MQLPEKLLESLQEVKGFEREAFEKVHASGGQVTSIRVNPGKFDPHNYGSGNLKFESEIVPWCRFGYYLRDRPSFTFDPLFHAGCYYVQEASSMFIEQALTQTVDLSKHLKILDLSAAPGGKSTHIQSLISSDSLLVSNEVIRARARVLEDNIIKWGSNNVVVTNNDPKLFARLTNFFDVVLVDAPCSGSGLFRRDEAAVDQWSENNVRLCSQRQQRILADVWPSLKRDGTLIYCTCSYSTEENEDILDWMMAEFQVERSQLRVHSDWKIDQIESRSGGTGYRFWPYKVNGEGFFIAAVQKTDGALRSELKSQVKTKKTVQPLTEKEIQVARAWLGQKDNGLVKNEAKVFAVRQTLLKYLDVLSDNLNVMYFGTQVGELVRDKLVPSHALALSNLASENTVKVELSYEDAIAYLKKKDLKKVNIRNRGWQMVTYRRHPLGWINVLPNRVNNYYPKELRILKDN